MKRSYIRMLALTVLICALFTGCGENKNQKRMDEVLGAFYKTFDGSDIEYNAEVYEQGKLNHTAQGKAKLDLDNGICEFSINIDDEDEVWNYSYEDKKVNKNEMKVMDLFLYNMNHCNYKIEGIQNSIICSLISDPPLEIHESLFDSEEFLESRDKILSECRKVLFTDGEIYNIINCDTIKAAEGTTYVFTPDTENYPKVMAKLQAEVLRGNGSNTELISEYETKIADKLKNEGSNMYQQITVNKDGFITEVDIGHIKGGYRLKLVLR